jgi:hypothetical protein
MQRLGPLPQILALLCLFVIFGLPAYATDATSSPCTPLLSIDANRNQRIDHLTVCTDGRLLASHAFSTPAPETMPADQTIWSYAGRLDEGALADLKTVLSRSDIAKLPRQIDVERDQEKYGLLWSVHVTIARSGQQQNISIGNLPLAPCGDMPREETASEMEIICLFQQLYSQAERGELPNQTDCGCRTLRAMAMSRDLPANEEAAEPMTDSTVVRGK